MNWFASLSDNQQLILIIVIMVVVILISPGDLCSFDFDEED